MPNNKSNLYNCPDCNNLVSSSAKSCPKCGRVLKKERNQTVVTTDGGMLGGIFIGIVFFIILYIMFNW